MDEVDSFFWLIEEKYGERLVKKNIDTRER